MWNIGEHRYDQMATVWEIEDKDNYAIVKLGTSRKDKKTGEYVNSSWFARFVGAAYPSILDVEPKTRIIIKQGGISQEPYLDKKGEKQWPKNAQVVVFAWEEQSEENNSGGGSKNKMDNPPAVEDDGDDIPF